MSAPHPGEIAVAAGKARRGEAPKPRRAKAKAKTGKRRPQVTDVTSARAGKDKEGSTDE